MPEPNTFRTNLKAREESDQRSIARNKELQERVFLEDLLGK